MLKKLGVTTISVAAGLMALAPAASAHEQHGGPGGAGGNVDSCNSSAGDASAVSEITGETVAAAVTQAPIGGNNTGNITCSNPKVLSDNKDTTINVIGVSEN